MACEEAAQPWAFRGVDDFRFHRKATPTSASGSSNKRSGCGCSLVIAALPDYKVSHHRLRLTEGNMMQVVFVFEETL